MMNNLFSSKFYYGFALATLVGLASCSSDDDATGGGGNGGSVANEQYVIAAESEDNSYIVTTEDITKGQLSFQGEGLQVAGNDLRWLFHKDKMAYSFVYRQGDPGTTQSYVLGEDGEARINSELDLVVSIQSMASIGDDIYMQFSSTNHENAVSTFYILNSATDQLRGPILINTLELANNGENAFITDITEHNDQIWVSYRTVIGNRDGSTDRTAAFNSDYNDHTYLAVFNKDLELQYRMEDTGRTGVVAGQERSMTFTGVEPVENGDVYVFSSAIDAPNVPSGILKVNNGERDFDKDYFFNISEASDGYKLYRTYYLGNNTFVLRMFSNKKASSAGTDEPKNKFAVVNVANKTFQWFDGIPEGIQRTEEPYVDTANNQVVFPIETSDYPRLYILDATTATATPGAVIQADNVLAVGKLSIQ